MTEEDLSWLVSGGKVFEYSTGRWGYEPVYSIREIESVAPKSFVVSGNRIRKDRMERRTAGYTTYYYISPDSKKAKDMIRRRELSEHYARVRNQADAFGKGIKDGHRLGRDERVGDAEALIEALRAYVRDEKGE